MEQFTAQQANIILESKAWLKWSDKEILTVQLFQNNLCMPFSSYHFALERYLGRPVYTHTIENNKERLIKEFLGNKNAPTLDEIIYLIPDRILANV